ncbi:MAG: hypothetical protein NVSMB10_07470 [Steroidobacteraceae bacterium]
MTLNLINNDKSAQLLKRRHGLGQAGQVDRIFQIEISALRGTCKLPGESSLAALTWTDQRYRRTGS